MLPAPPGAFIPFCKPKRRRSLSETHIDEPTLEDLAERLENLEIEHEVLSARHELLQDFLMLAISHLAEEQDREFLRGAIEKKISLFRHTTLFDILNDHQNLLRAFEAAMPKGGK